MKFYEKIICKTCSKTLEETKCTKRKEGGDQEGDKSKSKQQDFYLCRACSIGCDHDGHDLKIIAIQGTHNCMCNKLGSCKMGWNLKKPTICFPFLSL